jgi:hypothetical protein
LQISPRRAGHSAAITHERRKPYFGERPRGPSVAQKQLLKTHGLASQIDPDISFLARSGVPVSILELATRLAASRGTEARQELFVMGFNRERFWKALAVDLRLPFVPSLSDAALLEHPDSITVESVRQATSVMVRIGAAIALAVGPGPRDLMHLRLRLGDTPALAARFRIAAPETIRAFLVRKRHKALGRYATGRLAEASPALSSRRLHRGDATSGMVGLLAAGLGLCLLAPWLVVGAFGFGCSLFFINCSVWKAGRCRLTPTARPSSRRSRDGTASNLHDPHPALSRGGGCPGFDPAACPFRLSGLM